MIDDRPIRCFIHPKLKEELNHWHELLNKKSLDKTGYPLREGVPIASKICGKILENLRENTDSRDILIEHIDDINNKRTFNISIQVSRDENKNINIVISKIKGAKHNEVFF